MARTARTVLPELPHHVVLRGNNRRRLFSYPHEYRHFIYLLGRARAATRCKLHACVLMTNHVHLVVTPPTPESLASFVKSFAQRYAQSRNARRQASGRLFEERYFSRPILHEVQLAITTAYVELNPVRAGLAREARDYPWSSYGRHANTPCEIPSGIWSPTNWYLSLGPSIERRAATYVEWMSACHERALAPEEPSSSQLKLAAEGVSSGGRLERPDRSSAG